VGNFLEDAYLEDRVRDGSITFHMNHREIGFENVKWM
jgi:hypothetical protein